MVRAAPAEHEKFIEDAAMLASRADYAEALSAYESAYEALPEEEQGGQLGRFIVLDAAEAAIEDFRERGDVTSLERARTLLRAFAERTQTSGGPVQSKLIAIEQLVAEQQQPQPDTAATTIVVPDDNSGSVVHRDHEVGRPLGSTSSGATLAAPGRKRRVAGLVLTTLGGSMMLGGIGAIVAGSRQIPWMEARLAERGWEGEHPQHQAEYNRFFLDATRVRNIDYGIGGGLLLVGSAALVCGVVILARRRAR